MGTDSALLRCSRLNRTPNPDPNSAATIQKSLETTQLSGFHLNINDGFGFVIGYESRQRSISQSTLHIAFQCILKVSKLIGKPQSFTENTEGLTCSADGAERLIPSLSNDRTTRDLPAARVAGVKR